MRQITAAQQTAVLNALVEGCSVRSTQRMTGVHRDTVLRTMVRAADTAAWLADQSLYNLPCERVQVDEIWSFVGKKQREVTLEDDPARAGSFWTWVAIDAETKLVPCWRVGKRTGADATAFICDLAQRMAGRVQLSSDGLEAYVGAVEAGFGGDVDYGQIVKSYVSAPRTDGRYSPPSVTHIRKREVVGHPQAVHISTSYVERQNLTMRMSMRRFTRLTNAFSKKVENMRAAVDLHFFHYNFIRRHGALRMTPAMAAGVTGTMWKMADLVAYMRADAANLRKGR